MVINSLTALRRLTPSTILSSAGPPSVSETTPLRSLPLSVRSEARKDRCGKFRWAWSIRS